MLQECINCVWLFAISCTVACQAPLSTELSRQEYWSGLPFLLPGDLPDPGNEPISPTRAGSEFVYRKIGMEVSLMWKLLSLVSPRTLYKKKKNHWFRDFPAGPLIKTVSPMQGARVWSLVGELRLCMLHSAIRKEKIRRAWGQGLGIKYGFLWGNEDLT